jgi:hypothetical protein
VARQSAGAAFRLFYSTISGRIKKFKRFAFASTERRRGLKSRIWLCSRSCRRAKKKGDLMVPFFKSI